MHSVDINCDLGEGFNNDEVIMQYITSANIACGYHAGNQKTIRKTILLAKKHNVNIGAHPSFNDKKNFGRVLIDLTPKEVQLLVYHQLLLIQKEAKLQNTRLYHTKPHGALYNLAATNIDYAIAIGLAIKQIDSQIIYYGLANSRMKEAAKILNLSFRNEVFADRAYFDSGELVSRNIEGAVISNPDICKNRVLKMVEQKKTTSINNIEINIIPETICIHGDEPNSLYIAEAIYKHLSLHNIKIKG